MLSYFVLLLTLGFSSQDELPTVNTKLGTVRGHYKFSYDNRLFAAFEGIPYAKPPIGDLRFEEPKSTEPWPGILDATIIRQCAQLTKPEFADENEDCLYLNVYVPRKEPISNENLDVIVHIHGGAFMMGRPDIAGPNYLMDRDVVYVNLNYRLGAFGFLSTGDDVVPGNMGLKDQVLALKWVKLNIEYFGGNPNSVTITGGSAGGVCVHLHYFSNLSKGLFHRGVSHSGTALGPWSIYSNPLENTLKLAESVQCARSSIKEIVKCLKTKSAQEICNATLSTYTYFILPLAPFAPVIEKPSKTAFLTEHPYKMLQEGNIIDVPWISTATSDEGIILLFLVPNLEEIINNWHNYSPYALNYFHTVATSSKNDIAKKISEYYFENAQITLEAIIKAVGDRLFKVPMLKSVEMQAQASKSSIYSYIYSYISGVQLSAPNGTYNGSSHGADTPLIYDMDSDFVKKDAKLSENDEWMKTFLINILTTFAEDGIPKINNIKWNPVTTETNWEYLHISGKNKFTTEYNKEQNITKLWDSLRCDLWNQDHKVKDEF